MWRENILEHEGHIIKKTGQLGRPHYQPKSHGVGRAGEKGWHIFYSAVPILFLAEDAEASAIYEDKYPGPSIANYLTVTKYVGKDSWLSALDWINPLELIAIGGDIGRDLDRERTKELKSLLFHVRKASGGVVTYELDPEGQLVMVYAMGPKGELKQFTPEEYYTLLGNAANAEVESMPKDFDPRTHELYAGTLDPGYRIYFSNSGWSYDARNLAFFLPEADAKALQRVGQYYVNHSPRIKYLYAFAHPNNRLVLGEPGFKIPEDHLDEYEQSTDKPQFLDRMLEAAIAGRLMKRCEPMAP